MCFCLWAVLVPGEAVSVYCCLTKHFFNLWERYKKDCRSHLIFPNYLTQNNSFVNILNFQAFYFTYINIMYISKLYIFMLFILYIISYM